MKKTKSKSEMSEVSKTKRRILFLGQDAEVSTVEPSNRRQRLIPAASQLPKLHLFPDLA